MDKGIQMVVDRNSSKFGRSIIISMPCLLHLDKWYIFAFCFKPFGTMRTTII
jgi:hypothetical protein